MKGRMQFLSYNAPTDDTILRQQILCFART